MTDNKPYPNNRRKEDQFLLLVYQKLDAVEEATVKLQEAVKFIRLALKVLFAMVLLALSASGVLVLSDSAIELLKSLAGM